MFTHRSNHSRSQIARCARRFGQSMLELVAASTLVGVALVPALRIMSQSLKVSRYLQISEAMATYGASTLERSLAQTSTSWSTTTETGNFSAEGYASIAYTVLKSDSVSDGGIPNDLMAVHVTTWDDRNGNGVKDSGEPAVTFASKVARLTSYGYEARNS